MEIWCIIIKRLVLRVKVQPLTGFTLCLLWKTFRPYFTFSQRHFIPELLIPVFLSTFGYTSHRNKPDNRWLSQMSQIDSYNVWIKSVNTIDWYYNFQNPDHKLCFNDDKWICLCQQATRMFLSEFPWDNLLFILSRCTLHSQEVCDVHARSHTFEMSYR